MSSSDGLHAESLADREAHTYPVDDLEEFRERVGGGGFFRLAWCGSPACETALGDGTGATIRVILDGQAPDGPCLVDGASAATPCLSRARTEGRISPPVTMKRAGRRS